MEREKIWLDVWVPKPSQIIRSFRGDATQLPTKEVMCSSLVQRPLWVLCPWCCSLLFFLETLLPLVVSSSSLSSSCSSSLMDTPAAPLYPLFLLELHFVPMGFHSVCGIRNNTQDTHITVFSLNISCKLQTLAHPSIRSADAYCKSIARCCSSSDSKGAAFPALAL